MTAASSSHFVKIQTMGIRCVKKKMIQLTVNANKNLTEAMVVVEQHWDTFAMREQSWIDCSNAMSLPLSARTGRDGNESEDGYYTHALDGSYSCRCG
jgi:hypothetical protein